MLESFRGEHDPQDAIREKFERWSAAENTIDRLLHKLEAVEREGGDHERWMEVASEIDVAYVSAGVAFREYMTAMDKEREMDEAAYKKHLEQKAEADRISAEYEAER